MKQDCSAESWLKFFVTAGIPKEFAETYAVTFSKNQINLDMLPEIKKEYLVDMGITLMGHIIAILRHAKTVHEETVTKTTLLSNGTKAMQKDKLINTTTLSATNEQVPAQLPPTAPEPSSKVEQSGNATKSTIVKMRPLEAVITKRKTSNLEDSSPAKIVKLNPGAKTVQGLSKNLRQVEINKNEELESKKRVFQRLGMEHSVLSSELSSNGESVFSRLGNKSLAEDPIARAAISTSPATPNNNRILKTTGANGILKPQSQQPTVTFNSEIFLKQQPTIRSTSLMLNKSIKGTMRADETPMNKAVPSVSLNSIVLKNNSLKKDVHARLGNTRKESLLKSPSLPTVKHVRFGGITQKAIPKEDRSGAFKNVSTKRFDYIKQSVYNKGSIGMSTGVFSRLGI